MKVVCILAVGVQSAVVSVPGGNSIEETCIVEVANGEVFDTASGDKSCGVESQRADATQGSSVVNDTPNYLHIGEFVERKK